MSHLAAVLPCRRPELVVRPLGDQGPYVVKDPRTGAYYHLGDEEHFLLTQLDGQRDPDAVRAAFAERFGQPLSDEELQEFLDMATAQGFLQVASGGPQPPDARADQGADGPRSPNEAAPLGLRILCWRKSLFDPDCLFTWLAPKIGFFWTPAFLVLSAGCIILVSGVLWANRQEVAHSFLRVLRWETAPLAWLVLLLVTICHEFAHGLTCKRHGGEVHEVGFLLIFFMPCFYCNVSDSWLFKEKSKRLWVTLAGGYFELFLWALAVFVWRVTMPDSLIHYLAFVVLSACGVQTLFNFNPLIKLDGYYLLSDWLEVPNLQRRSANYVKSRLRWGAAQPELEPRGNCLLTYGLVSWLYSLAFLALSLVVLSHFLGARLGLLGLAVVALLALLSLRGLFHDCTAGEVRQMIRFRRKRTAVWLLLLGGVPAGLFAIPMEDRASGPFQVRPAVRAELRAPVAGFLSQVYCDEGDRVAPGMLLVRLDVPDLASRIAQKQAKVREARARLRLLEIGPRYEELVEQRRRVERAVAWRDLARQDLAEGLHARGMRVHYFLRGARYWADVLDETESRIVQERLAGEGVTVHTNTQVKQAVGARGRLIGVDTEAGAHVPCDLLAVAIGVRPRAELARAAGLKVEKGVVVNEFLQTSRPEIFAAGDVAQVHDPRLNRATLDVLWSTALAQGQAAGANMAGGRRAYVKGISFNVTQLTGLKVTLIGSVGGGKDEDLVSIARGDSEVWRLPLRGRILTEQDDLNRVQLLVGDKRIVGALVMGDQTWSWPLQKLVAGRVDISSIRSALVGDGAEALTRLARFYRHWEQSGEKR